MPYTSQTWLQLRNRLIDRLGDNLFFSDTGSFPEISGYLRESLRVWNCLARFWRDRVTFSTAAGTQWYRLPDQTTAPANIFSFTVPSQQLVAEAQYHVLEPATPTVWTGTDMFTLDAVVNSLQRRRDQFLLETAITLNQSIVGNPISGEGRMEMPETTIDVRRVAWRSGAGTYSHLWRRDEWAANAQNRMWNISPSARPTSYSLISMPPLRLQFIPPPSLPGQIDLLSVNRGAAIDIVANTLIGIPDDFAWAIKWGALADIMDTEGQGNDSSRSKYCEERYQQGSQLAQLEPTVFLVQINGVNVPIVSLQELDAHRRTWQNTTGRPVLAALNRDMLALSPVPDAIYSVTLDALIPAPIPTADADQLNLGPEILNVVLDYAHHIASFKQGGLEFFDTQRGFENMIRLASDYNAKLNAMAIFRDALEDKSTREEAHRLRREVKDA